MVSASRASAAASRLATLSNREDPARDRCGKEDGDARKQPAQAAVGAADAFRLLLGRFAALGDEPTLELVQLEGVVGAPVERGGETSAAVELALVAPCRLPFGRRLRDVAPKPTPVGVLLDPLV